MPDLEAKVETGAPDPAVEVEKELEEVFGYDPDMVYSKYVPQMKELFEPLRRARGPFRRPLRCGTLFGAMGSDVQMCKLSGVPADFIFSNDKKRMSSPSWSGCTRGPRPTLSTRSTFSLERGKVVVCTAIWNTSPWRVWSGLHYGST